MPRWSFERQRLECDTLRQRRTPRSLVERVTAPDGTERVASIATMAMRSDGSIVQKLGPLGRGSRFIRFASGVQVYTNDVTRKMSSSQIGSAIATERQPAASCALSGTSREAFAGLETLASLRAAKYIEKSDDRELTRWFALDYGCAPIADVLEFGTQTSKKELVSFVAGEPDPSLFVLPDDYEEGPPSRLAPPGIVRGEALLKRDELLDRKYYAQRQQQR